MLDRIAIAQVLKEEELQPKPNQAVIAACEAALRLIKAEGRLWDQYKAEETKL
ncbi:MAG: hypothetical protein KGJ13_07510 [Patescibacteria group bacterium]|nr:hypothetical protein [Patescibacteria group bacterium]